MLARTPLEAISQFHDEMVTIRRDLHTHPELGFQEFRTAGLVAGSLEALGLEVYRGIGKTGVVGVLRGLRSDSERMIGLRADMDALPMQEIGSGEHRSRNPGVMHGCGHDGHTTILLAAARYLVASPQFNGSVAFIFQPAEEGLGGAQAMIDDGLFERFPCDAVYALHNWPGLAPSYIGLNSGPMMAAADRFEIQVKGKGGHGAHPYQAIDPILVCAQIITALQSIVSRNVNPMDSAVVSVGSVQAGQFGAMSVIPEMATIVGTVRTFRPSVQHMIEDRMRSLVTSIAQGFGASAQLRYEKLFPATINTPHEADIVARAAKRVVGDERVVRDLVPSMGSEDFSFMLQHKPGAYFRLGQGGEPGSCQLHNPSYDFNDAVIPTGAAVFVEIVRQSLPL
ncbi:M20 aminoacylase family protein [Orrella marina]|uniref:Amidohydrolase n=1 Tax=Orrella marina TaxID=2163011 RepID=A0A2R4XKD2_9BURK|nr:M20 aminoacylase family protein [Orrella marina]AWB34285.1 amidohydrolase [Orrella marina]